MDNKIEDGINKLAEAVIETLKIEVPVKNIEAIAKRMGGSIVIDPLLKKHDHARIVKIGYSIPAFVITIPLIADENKKNFFIARELGYLFMHMGYLISDKLWEYQEINVPFRKQRGEMERQALEFAFAFLTPKGDFKECMQKNYQGNYDMERVATFFGVPVNFAIRRGQNIGYLSLGQKSY